MAEKRYLIRKLVKRINVDHWGIEQMADFCQEVNCIANHKPEIGVCEELMEGIGGNLIQGEDTMEKLNALYKLCPDEACYNFVDVSGRNYLDHQNEFQVIGKNVEFTKNVEPTFFPFFVIKEKMSN